MEPISEGKQVLSDIEHSIQNALALFSSKDLGGGINELFVIDDPIVSLHDPLNKGPKQTDEIPSFLEEDFVQITNLEPVEPTKKMQDHQDTSQPSTYSHTTQEPESTSLPFLENPVKSTVEEMQRMLNSRSHMPSLIAEPTPEEILNLYSKDLGISFSNNVSPRVSPKHQLAESNDNETSKSKQSKKEKKALKKQKQQNLKTKQDNKGDPKKEKPSKSEKQKEQDNRLADIMNIYGCADKIKKPRSDSTLGSKSGFSKNISSKSMRKLTTINSSSKASSIAISKKSKKKKLKRSLSFEIDLNDVDFGGFEKSSKISARKKNKGKNNVTKFIKKTNLKRKIGYYSNNENGELNVSKSYQGPNRDGIYNTNKNSNSSYFISYNSLNENKPERSKYPNQIKKTSGFTQFRGLKPNENLLNKRQTLNVLSSSKHQQGMNSNLKQPPFQETQTEQPDLLIKQLQTEDKKGKPSLKNKVSEENKLNKYVLMKDSGVEENLNTNGAQIHHDSFNNGFLAPSTQFHYTLPTESSRSKEVERFLNGHYQHLPFVIGQSTTKSHNLWVNIQEALSLIKHKVPHNLELASVVHDSESERPLSVMSKYTTKSCKKCQQCPVLVSDGLYDIPEVNAEGEDVDPSASWEDQPECIQANLDPNYVRPRCSCLPQSTLSYKKVLRQIFGGGCMSETSMDSNGVRDFIQDQGDSYTAELRKVLISFTQEFEELNSKYEEMLSDPNASKEELHRLEMELDRKEDEIKDIIARFNEMRELSEKVQLEGTQSRFGLYNLEAYKSTTSVRLAKTLRRVQQFKETLKSRPSVPYLNKNAFPKGAH